MIKSRSWTATTPTVLRRLRHVARKWIRPIFGCAGADGISPPPRGTRLDRDIRKYLSGYDVELVFDVGANSGQTTREFLRLFPEATIYSFEPVPETFRTLRSGMEGSDRVRCFRTAMGSEVGQADMVLFGNSLEHRLAEHHQRLGYESDGAPRVSVRVETIDRFCGRRGINHISLLKIDTEGHDLAVVWGSARMLEERRIDLLQAEVGLNPLNELHVPLEELKEALAVHGYHLFGIYDQVGEYALSSSILRRANAVFLSPRLVRER